ncbi:MAG: 2-oxoacid:acceptor oxidoreductase family protein [Candidatus Gastranaerophilales bacterium]|nr:2-oxoacid:acceptor oxidoreductase family protein [Candidatus Gastranaerophilales bacterium]
MDSNVLIAGFGGQGVLFIGQLLAAACMEEGLNVTWYPAYGAEMRGGTVNCTVCMSDDEVACAYVETPENVIALNAPSFERFENKIKSGGIMIVNSSLVKSAPSRTDITYKFVPMTDIAHNSGHEKMANIVSLGAFLKTFPVAKKESITSAMKKKLTGKKASMLEGNIQAFEQGFAAVN